MMTWISENIATILVGAILAGVVALVIVHMIRNKRKGRSSCGCGCSGCPMSGACHHKK